MIFETITISQKHPSEDYFAILIPHTCIRIGIFLWGIGIISCEQPEHKMGELKQRKKDAPKSDKKPSADQKEKSKESAAAQSPPANAKSKKEPAKKQREPKPAEQRDESDEDSDVPGDSYGYAGSDDEDDAGDLEDGPSIADKDDDYDESQRVRMGISYRVDAVPLALLP